MLVALVALGVALCGQPAYATVKTFMLGTANSSDAPTVVSAASTWPTTGNQRVLQLINNNTTAGATALGLNVATGHPPFTVNSAQKVNNLNADQLDGLDSGNFVQGSGRVLSLRRTLAVGQTAVAFTFPGFFEVEINCDLASGQPPPVADYTFTNLSTTYPLDYIDSGEPDLPRTIDAGSFVGYGTSGGQITTIQVGQNYSLVPGGPPTRTRVATLWLTQRGGDPCHFQGQLLVQGA
jgi:hypothetical protein